ncbi:MAG TPA: hypothetical protein VNW73_01410 [Ktedonobacteraceae bacterium]|jgi:hypothetical protein|nr:hypothetical protein [Ktedonobacteraceae bacterium]
MTHFRRGLFAGLLAGLLLAMLNFVTDGTPGRTLPDALHWFGITIADPTLSRFTGFFLLIILGGIAGIIFGLVQGERDITIGRSLLSGLVLGLVWWLLFSLLLTNIMSHASSPLSLQFGMFLATFPIDLLFGIVLGAIYYQLQGQPAMAEM